MWRCRLIIMLFLGGARLRGRGVQENNLGIAQARLLLWHHVGAQWGGGEFEVSPLSASWFCILDASPAWQTGNVLNCLSRIQRVTDYSRLTFRPNVYRLSTPSVTVITSDTRIQKTKLFIYRFHSTIHWNNEIKLHVHEHGVLLEILVDSLIKVNHSLNLPAKR